MRNAWILALALCLVSAPGCRHHDGGHGEHTAGKEGETAEEHGQDPEWCYEGPCGPEYWGDLSPKWRECKEGREQSPVDIAGAAPGTDLPALEPAYGETAVTVINSGHDVRVDYDAGSTLAIGGRTFALDQFHFHSPSENTLDGHSEALEMHLVHVDADGGLAVIGVFLREGEESPFLAQFWDAIPAEEGEQETDVRLNVADYLPESLDYWHFPGSLTTPGCGEPVRWFVLQEPIPVSAAQVEQFLSIIGANARPTQPLNDRTVVSGPS